MGKWPRQVYKSETNKFSENGQNEDNDTNDNSGTENDDQTDPATAGTVAVNQMTGKIYLPRTQNQPSKREIHVVVSTRALGNQGPYLLDSWKDVTFPPWLLSRPIC